MPILAKRDIPEIEERSSVKPKDRFIIERDVDKDLQRTSVQDIASIIISDVGLERAIGFLTESYDGTVTSIKADIDTAVDFGVDYVIVAGFPEPRSIGFTVAGQAGPGDVEIPIEEQRVVASSGSPIFRAEAQAEAVGFFVKSEIEDPETGLKAQASATFALTSRVEVNEDGITAQAQAVLTIESRIDDPETGLQAQADATFALTTKVNVNEDDITINASAIIDINSQLTLPDGRKVTATAYFGLETEVTTNTDGVSSNAQAVLDLDSQLTLADGSKVTASAYFTMETNVYDPETGLAAAHSEINLRVEADGVIAAINLSAESEKVGGARILVTGQTTFTNDVRIKGVIESNDGLIVDAGGMIKVIHSSTDSTEIKPGGLFRKGYPYPIIITSGIYNNGDVILPSSYPSVVPSGRKLLFFISPSRTSYDLDTPPGDLGMINYSSGRGGESRSYLFLYRAGNSSNLDAVTLIDAIGTSRYWWGEVPSGSIVRVNASPDNVLRLGSYLAHFVSGSPDGLWQEFGESYVQLMEVDA